MLPGDGAGSRGTGRRLRQARALLASALVLGVGATLTIAAWNDREFASAEFTAGTFDLVSRTDTQQAFASHPVGNSVRINFPVGGMMPGESRAGYVQIQSAGTLGGQLVLDRVELDSTLNTAADQAFARGLQVRMSTALSTDPNQVSCGPDTPGANAALGLGNLPVLDSVSLAGQSGNTATYCVVVSVPGNAPPAMQGGRARPTWVFLGTAG